MSVIVTDTGFAPDDWDLGFTVLQDTQANAEAAIAALDLLSDADPTQLQGDLAGLRMIRVDFPSFADGRGFTIARHLRRLGYDGRLRAKGHVIADQYAMARRAGFDEVEISDDLAARQPEAQWTARADWTAHDYQKRLRG